MRGHPGRSLGGRAGSAVRARHPRRGRGNAASARGLADQASRCGVPGVPFCWAAQMWAGDNQGTATLPRWAGAVSTHLPFLEICVAMRFLLWCAESPAAETGSGEDSLPLPIAHRLTESVFAPHAIAARRGPSGQSQRGRSVGARPPGAIRLFHWRVDSMILFRGELHTNGYSNKGNFACPTRG